MIIPEIDISALVDENAGEEAKEACRQEIHTACKDVGFLSIINHGVSLDLINKMEAAAKGFFYLPKTSKMSIAPRHYNPANTHKYRGYFPATVFGKEGLDMSDPTREVSCDPSCHLHEVTTYPADFPAESLDIFKEYFTALHKLSTTLVKATFKTFGAEESIVDAMFKRPDLCTTFRLNYYPQHEEGYTASEISAQDGVKLACETHTDSVIFTVLFQDMTGGLQVQSPKDLSWHNVPCNRKAFVVNTGRALQQMTNDKYTATFHRVLLGDKERLSIPFFFEPVADFVIDSKTLCPNEDRNYEPLRYQEHILGMVANFKEYQRDY